MIDLRLGDCLEILPTLADGSVDAVITDPPYGINYKTGGGSYLWGNGSISNDKTTIARDKIADWINKNNVAGIMFGSWKIGKPPGIRMLLIWDTKGALGMGDLRLPWKPSHQEIYILGNPNMFIGKRTSDVIRCAPVQSMAKNGRVHPMQKPVELMKELILKTSADTILDPFMGSGTTGVACVQTGRSFIGIEIEPKYFEIAEKRIAEAQLQTRMPI